MKKGDIMGYQRKFRQFRRATAWALAVAILSLSVGPLGISFGGQTSEESIASSSNAITASYSDADADATESDATDGMLEYDLATPADARSGLTGAAEVETELVGAVTLAGVSIYGYIDSMDTLLATVTEGIIVDNIAYISLSSILSELEALGFDADSFNAESGYQFGYTDACGTWSYWELHTQAIQIGTRWYICVSDDAATDAPENNARALYYIPGNATDSAYYQSWGCGFLYTDGGEELLEASNHFSIAVCDPDGLTGQDMPDVIWRQAGKAYAVSVPYTPGIGYSDGSNTLIPERGSDGTYTVTLASLLTGDTTLTAVPVDCVTVTVHDIDADGNEIYNSDPEGSMLTVIAEAGAKLKNLDDAMPYDGRPMEDCVWYTVDSNSVKTLLSADDTFDADADIYTYHYSLTLQSSVDDPAPVIFPDLREGMPFSSEITDEQAAILWVDASSGDAVDLTALAASGITENTTLTTDTTGFARAELDIQYSILLDWEETEVKKITSGYANTAADGTTHYYVSAKSLVPFNDILNWDMDSYQGEALIALKNNDSTATFLGGAIQDANGNWYADLGTAATGTTVLLLPNNTDDFPEFAKSAGETISLGQGDSIGNDGVKGNPTAIRVQGFYTVYVIDEDLNVLEKFYAVGKRPCTCTIQNKNGYRTIVKNTDGDTSVTDNGNGTSTVTFESTQMPPYILYIEDGVIDTGIHESSSGITVNLFNYDDFILDDWTEEEATWNDTVTWRNAVNEDHALNCKLDNQDDSSVDPWNAWVGYQAAIYPDIVQDALGSDGKPALNADTVGSSESLAYLFPDAGGNTQDGVYAYYGVDGLLQKDSDGYYYYDSAENYAEYDDGTGEFVLYHAASSIFNILSTAENFERSGSLYADNIETYGEELRIGFLPFNSYDGTRDVRDVDYHFGMEMEAEFWLTQARTKNGEDITFNFSGDDDLYLYLDGKLIGDLGGIHNTADISVNFTDGTIVRSSRSVGWSEETSITALYGDESWMDEGIHTIKMYYMERGGGTSNLKLSFNLQTEIPLTIKKQSTWDGSTVSGAEFAVYSTEDCSGTPVYVSADDDGIYTFGLGEYLGEQLYLKEVSAPEGYVLDDKIYAIAFSDDIATLTSLDGTVTLENDASGVTIFPEDPDPKTFKTTTEMPETGGRGALSMICGLIAILAWMAMPDERKLKRKWVSNGER